MLNLAISLNFSFFLSVSSSNLNNSNNNNNDVLETKTTKLLACFDLQVLWAPDELRRETP